MPFISFAVAIGIKAFRQVWRYLVELYESVYSILSSVSFGMFISYSSLNLRSIENFLKAHELMLTFFIYFSNPYLVSFYGYPFLKNNKNWEDFIKNHNYINKVWHNVKNLYEKGLTTDDIPAVLVGLLTSMPFPFMGVLENIIVKDAFAYYREFVYQLYNIFVKNNKDIFKTANEVVQKFDSSEPSQLEKALVFSEVIKTNPLIIFELPVILSHLQLHYAYKYATQLLKEPKLPPDFFNKLNARLYFDGKLVRQKRLQSDGTVFFNIPKSEWNKYSPSEIMINVMGLKTRYIIGLENILKRFKFYHYEDKKWYCGDDKRYYTVREEEYPNIGKGYRVGYELGTWAKCIDGNYYDDLEMFIVFEAGKTKIWIFGSATAWDIDIYFDDEKVATAPAHNKMWCPSDPIRFDEAVAYLEI